MHQELKTSQLKVNFNGNLKRVKFANTFNELIKEITTAFNIKLSGDSYFTLFYNDDENDQISISNDFDLEQAKLFAQNYKKECLKVEIKVNSMYGEEFVQEKFQDINLVSGEKKVTNDNIKSKIDELRNQIDLLRLQANQIKTSVYIPMDMKDNCVIANKSDFDIQIKEYTDLRQTVKLTNTGQKQWSKYYTLTCLDSLFKDNYLKGNNLETKTVVKPGETINLEIYIPKDMIVSGKFNSIWQMKNDKNEYFGEQIELQIHVISNNQINIVSNFFEMADKTEYDNLLYTSEYKAQLKEMKTTYDLHGISDQLLLQLLQVTKGNIEDAITLLF